MEAQTLNCPMCGATAETDAPNCQYCGSRLATVACPSCFGMMFQGSRHCPHCGAKPERALVAQAETRRCPRCRLEMMKVAVGATTLRECPQCAGLWVDAGALDQICSDREQQSAVLGTGVANALHAVQSSAGGAVRYVPCPECGQLMNRLNFARYSGVIVDLCKKHGTWFDREELRQVVEFIRGGGLDLARSREKEALANERRQLQQEQLAAANGHQAFNGITHDDERTSVLSFASEFLNRLLD